MFTAINVHDVDVHRVLLLELAGKCVQASYQAQSSLSIALLNLIQGLKEFKGINIHNVDYQSDGDCNEESGVEVENGIESNENDTRREDLVSSTDHSTTRRTSRPTDHTNIGGRNNNNIHHDDNDNSSDDVFKRVALSLFTIETIHLMDDDENDHYIDNNHNHNRQSRTSSTSTTPTIQQRINQALDLCGLHICFRIAIDVIYSTNALSKSESLSGAKENNNISIKKGHSDVVRLISCTKFIKRILLHCEYYQINNSDLKSDRKPKSRQQYHSILQQFLHEHFTPQSKRCKNQDFVPQSQAHRSIQIGVVLLERQLLDLINSILIVLPTQIANAYHGKIPSKTKILLPLWSTRSRFFMKLVESSLHTSLLSSSSVRSKLDGDNDSDAATGDSGCGSAVIDGNNDLEVMYSTKLIEVLLRHGHSDDVAKGVYTFWKYYYDKKRQTNTTPTTTTSTKNTNDKHCNIIIQKKIQSMLNTISTKLSSSTSSRNYAIFVRSCMKLIISSIEIYPTTMTRNNVKSLCDEYCLPFLMDICSSTGLLLFDNEDIREMIVNLLILSSSPSSTLSSPFNSDNNDENMNIDQKIITRCVVELLLMRENIDNTCSAKNNEDDLPRLDILLIELNKVIVIWNDTMFINQTDYFQQRHVTSFILDAMDYFKKDSSNATDSGSRNSDVSALQQSVIQEIVLGVTNRLNVSETSIRIDGMMVAEKVAPLLGQSLQFDELDGLRDEDLKVDGDCETELNNVNDTSAAVKNPSNGKHDTMQEETKQMKKKKKKAKTTIEIDPDEEYDSDGPSDPSDIESVSSTSDSYISSDSEWGEENLEQFTLSDDEEDLRPVPKPRFLQECLDLLRSTDDDEAVRFKHETALEEISTLVRDCPPDLCDIAPFLADALVEIENKYNYEMFNKYRWDGLCALTVCSPFTTVPLLQRKLFEESPLNLRLDILNVLKSSSLELCGQLELQKQR